MGFLVHLYGVTSAREKLGWQAQYKMQDIVQMMVEARRSEVHQPWAYV